MLKEQFIILCQNFTQDKKLIKELWNEIIIKYLNPKRFYHNLEHLEDILNKGKEINLNKEEKIIFIWTTFYHDIIYDVTKKNNEVQSAILAKKRGLELGISFNIIKQVVEIILLTKTHNKTNNKLYKLFLDADLSILGSEVKIYKKYTLKIRKEYNLYNDEVYKVGRLKVLKHFLKKEQIFQSDFFYDKYEKFAQKNIQNELLLLK